MEEKRSLPRRIVLGVTLTVALLLIIFACFDYYYTGFRRPLTPTVMLSPLNSPPLFNFTLTSDAQLKGNPAYVFAKMKEKLGGAGAFHITLGDILPIERTYKALLAVFGEETVWYPCQGNHDHRYERDVEFTHCYFEEKLRGKVKEGPAGSERTTYSFDYGNAHFVVLNLYYDGKREFGTDGDVVDELFEWLRKDLEENEKPIVFVFGHEPAFPFHRHQYDCLNRYREHRDRFWQLLEGKGVVAFFTGHTQVPSVYRQTEGGTYQVSLPQAQGDRKNENDGFMNVIVHKDGVEFQMYTNKNRDGEYSLFHNFFYELKDTTSAE